MASGVVPPPHPPLIIKKNAGIWRTANDRDEFVPRARQLNDRSHWRTEMAVSAAFLKNLIYS